MPDVFTALFRLFVVALALVASAGASAAEGVEQCASCHAAETKDWRHSHHGWALREPTPDNVLGDFSGVNVEHKGVTTRFFRDGDRFMVETDGPDGKLTIYPVAYTVGVAPLQQYLFDTGNGHLQTLDFAWDVANKRWFHLYPQADTSAGNAFHWTGTYKNWQTRCAECHQTGFVKGYDPKARAFSSRWSALTVTCASCHGSATDHVAWARNPSGYAGAGGANAQTKGFAFRLGPGHQAEEIAVCGPCHARREPLGADSPPPGAPLSDHYNLALIRNGLYFPDGQQNDEVYVLGSFLQSKMAAKGVTCSNCHTPHTGALVAEGDAVCTQCHNPSGNAAFPSLRPARYDTAEHHHHPPESEGARCVSCHMPERNYMLIDPRRDHYFRMPDPGGSALAGSPDACTSCHTDKTQGWAEEQVAAWYPDGRYKERRTTTALFADLFQSPGAPAGTKAALAFAADKSHPAILRASALDGLLDSLNAEELAGVQPLLADESELVRTASTRLMRSLPPDQRGKLLAPLLSDPVRAVRIAAAMNMAGVSPAGLSPEQAKAFEAASKELQQSLAARADFPETQMVIAGLAMTMRNWPAARAALAEAVALDPQLTEAWLMQGRIAAATGDATGAEGALKSGLAKDPSNATLKGELVGLYTTTGRFAEAIPLMRDLVAASPKDVALRRALSLALLQTGEVTAARTEIEAGLTAAPGNLDLLTLLAVAQLMTGDTVGARATVSTIRERDPLRPLPPALEQLQ